MLPRARSTRYAAVAASSTPPWGGPGAAGRTSVLDRAVFRSTCLAAARLNPPDRLPLREVAVLGEGGSRGRVRSRALLSELHRHRRPERRWHLQPEHGRQRAELRALLRGRSGRLACRMSSALVAAGPRSQGRAKDSASDLRARTNLKCVTVPVDAQRVDGRGCERHALGTGGEGGASASWGTGHSRTDRWAVRPWPPRLERVVDQPHCDWLGTRRELHARFQALLLRGRPCKSWHSCRARRRPSTRDSRQAAEGID